MAQTTTTNPASVSNSRQTYLNRQLLKHRVENLRLYEMAHKQNMPKNAGSTTMRMFRKQKADPADIFALTEGTPSTTINEVELDYIDLTIAQHGDQRQISDLMHVTDIMNWLKINSQDMGEAMAHFIDNAIRNKIVTGTADSDSAYQGHERFAGVTLTGDSSSNFASLDAAATSASIWTKAIHMGCLTMLKVKQAPKKNGKYMAIVPPQIAHDMRLDTNIETIWSRTQNQNLYKDHLGSFDGVEFVEATNPFIENTAYGTFAAAGDIYSVFYCGDQAFACGSIEGTGNPFSPSITVLDKPDKSDPNNQKIVLATKVYHSEVLLHREWLVHLRAKSSYA